MTHDRSNIGLLRQIRWYLTRYRVSRGSSRSFAYLLVMQNRAVGFGILAQREFLGAPRWVVTGGVREAYRGFGLGKLVFRYLSYLNDENVYLDVLETNEPALSLYRSIGYEEVDRTDGIISMRLLK
jgi:ribosomal protein S18 acetylase RimI-like enzyme